MPVRETTVTAAPLGRHGFAPPLPPETDWLAAIVAVATTVGLVTGIWSWFHAASGIQGEPGTLLVMVACVLILVGLLVVLLTGSRGIRVLFDWLILIGAALTALAAWFLMSWVLMGAMIVAAVVQAIRLARPRH